MTLETEIEGLIPGHGEKAFMVFFLIFHLYLAYALFHTHNGLLVMGEAKERNLGGRHSTAVAFKLHAPVARV